MKKKSQPGQVAAKELEKTVKKIRACRKIAKLINQTRLTASEVTIYFNGDEIERVSIGVN